MGGAHGLIGLHALKHAEVVRKQENVSVYHPRAYLIVMVIWNIKWSVITSVAQVRPCVPCSWNNTCKSSQVLYMSYL